ncbi:MAG: recombinase family protein [Planctomycetes bacterium]|nr:recombinase family protein [Planctomycetota bacterium]
MRVCLYLRVSTDKQANKEDGSLDTQLDRLMSYVNFRKSSGDEWTVTEKFVEGEKNGQRRGRSAKDTRREGLQKLLELAKARLIDVVVVTKIDRISRSVIDFLVLVKELDSYGVKLVSLRENIDLTTPSGKFQTTILIALAEHEREQISARTKEKVEWRVQKGLPIGPPPIGYQMKNKMYVIDEEYAKHIRAMDRIYLENESSDVVVREFKRLGYRTPRGHMYALPLICRMLRNPTYAAKIEYEGDLYDAQWKPLRSWDTHQQIQKQMDANLRRRRRQYRENQEHVYLLQGLLRCARCEHVMTPTPGTGRNGRYYAYYSCTKAQKSLGEACPREFVPAEPVDRAVLEFLKQLEVEPERIRQFVKQANAMASETVGKLREDLMRVREQLAAVRSKISNITDVIAEKGKEALASVGRKLEELETEARELEETEARLKKEIEAEECQILNAQDQIKTLSLFKELVELNEEHPERIRAMLPRFIDYVVWRQDKGQGTLEVALFPTPFVKPKDVTLRKMLSELLERRGMPVACGPEKLSVRSRLSIGVPDGI